MVYTNGCPEDKIKLVHTNGCPADKIKLVHTNGCPEDKIKLVHTGVNVQKVRLSRCIEKVRLNWRIQV